MNPLSIIAVVLIFIAALFVVAYFVVAYEVEKARYEEAIIYIEGAIEYCTVNQSNYRHIIGMFSDLCKYSYQDPKRNDKAAKAFKIKYWKEHALNNNLK